MCRAFLTKILGRRMINFFGWNGGGESSDLPSYEEVEKLQMTGLRKCEVPVARGICKIYHSKIAAFSVAICAWELQKGCFLQVVLAPDVVARTRRRAQDEDIDIYIRIDI